MYEKQTDDLFYYIVSLISILVVYNHKSSFSVLKTVQ